MPLGAPAPLPRLLLRLPVWLFRLRLGGLLGRRYLLLTHTGDDGAPRETVLEVLRQDGDTGTVTVPAAWGERAEWFRNLRARPEAQVMLGTARWRVRAEVLPVEDAAQEWYVFATDYTTAFARLTRLATGERWAATMPVCRKLAERMPVVALIQGGPS